VNRIGGEDINWLIWVVEGSLALLFLWLAERNWSCQRRTRPYTATERRFFGVVEILGGLGSLLPGMLRIRTEFTALAAAGLVIIVTGAMAVTIQTMGLGICCSAVCNGRACIVCGLRALASGAPRHACTRSAL
jgi:hypothetical protein